MARSAMVRWSLTLAGVAALALVPEVACECTPPRSWQQYREVAVKARCPDHNPAVHPDYSRPVSCATGAVVEPLAFSVANEAFVCNQACVFSIQSAEAWRWNPDTKCWDEDKTCLALVQDKAFADDRKKALCKDCTRNRKGDELSVEVVKEKCADYQANSRPRYHTPTQCGGGDTRDLRLALANGAYAGCSHWCVFSIRTPSQQAWLWNDGKLCWEPSAECVQHKSELAFVTNLRSRLCDEPCKQPRKASDLTVQHIRERCPQYQPNSQPRFHQPTACGPDQSNEELHESLANLAFASCSAWCVFSVHRPGRKAWMWNPTNACWADDNSCLDIAGENAFATNLKESLCLAPRAFPDDPEPQSVQVPRGTTAGDEDRTNKGARKRQVDGAHLERSEALKQRQREQELETQKRLEDTRKKQEERRAKRGAQVQAQAQTQAQAKAQAKTPTPKRMKDPLKESYTVFGGMLVAIGLLVALVACTGDDGGEWQRRSSHWG